MLDEQLNLTEELRAIPPDYQEMFRQTLEREMAETGCNETDGDILIYLRRRRDDFQRGGFIRPDGRPGVIAMAAADLYERALPQLAQGGLGQDDSLSGRRGALLKGGGLALLALLFLLLALRGRAAQEGGRMAANEPVAEAAAAVLLEAGQPTPTAPPPPTGAEESLQTIGSLGGALTIGRPSALTIHYAASGETVALPIDPSRTTNRGELRYHEGTMRSDNPAAVWLFGSVLNYGLGVPQSVIGNLQIGDRLTARTDTGAALQFVVVELGTAAAHDAGRLLSQNRLGLTLFALPAAAVDDVAFALADYDLVSETVAAPPAAQMGEGAALGVSGVVTVTGTSYSHTRDGRLQINLTGAATGLTTAQSLLLTLAAPGEQTTATTLTVDEAGRWGASLVLSGDPMGQPLLAELRALPGGSLALVALGEAPDLRTQLTTTITSLAWTTDAERIVLTAEIANPGPGAVYLAADFIDLIGGDAYESVERVAPRLPLLLEAGGTVGATALFLPIDSSVQLQIGADLWRVEWESVTP
jgi:hypothetical protein